MEQVKIDTFDLFIANVLLVRAEGKKVLIDICEAKRVEQVEAALVRIGLSPNDIDLIVCTHGHADHCGGARHFQERYQIPVALARATSKWSGEGRTGLSCHIPSPTGWYGGSLRTTTNCRPSHRTSSSSGART